MALLDKRSVILKTVKCDVEPELLYKFPKSDVESGDDFDLVVDHITKLFGAPVSVDTQKRWLVFTKMKKNEKSESTSTGLIARD